LHLKEGLAAVKEQVASGKVRRGTPAILNGSKNQLTPLIAAPYFVVDRFELGAPQSFRTADESGINSVQIIVVVDGCAAIEARGMEPVTAAKGDAVAVPASMVDFSVRPQWNVEFLKAYVPGQVLPEPATQ
jgi:mannose-6-phosphate isomerase class I